MVTRRQTRLCGIGFVGLLSGLLLGFIVFSIIDKVMHARLSYNPDNFKYGNRHTRIRVGHPQDLQLTTQSSRRSKSASNKRGRIDFSEFLDESESQAGNIGKASAVKSGKIHIGNENKGDTYHTLMTGNGSPYLNFQTRIMYATYKLAKEMPGGEKMVAFTRILHRSLDDEIMDEVPTWRTNPLDPVCDKRCDFPVGNRARAVRQFFEAAEQDPKLIKAPWILMLEGDYVFMKPLPSIPMADSDLPSWAFPYSYIAPQLEGLSEIMRRMYPKEKGPLSDIPNSGPAPVLLRVHEWEKVVHDWERLSRHVDEDKQTERTLGWVREMYAFSISLALQHVKVELKYPPESPLMAQPPQNSEQGNGALLHYTWGILVEDEKSRDKVWIFDKREYVQHDQALQVPKLPLPPPWRSGLILHDGEPWTESLWNMTNEMLKQMNRGIQTLPDLWHKKIPIPDKRRQHYSFYL